MFRCVFIQLLLIVLASAIEKLYAFIDGNAESLIGLTPGMKGLMFQEGFGRLTLYSLELRTMRREIFET